MAYNLFTNAHSIYKNIELMPETNPKKEQARNTRILAARQIAIDFVNMNKFTFINK